MKRFTSLFILCFIIFPFFHSCVVNNWKEVKGNYQIVTEKIAISDYDEILLDLPATVIYRQISQEEPFLQVTVDDNILPSLEIGVQGRQLVITQKNDSNLHPSRLVIYTNSKHLSKVNVKGSGDVLLEKAVNAGDMEISVTGSGNVKTDSLYCETIRVLVAGSGDVEMKGAANRADFKVTGSGAISAFDYLVQQLDCQVAGSGDIRASVYKKLNATVSGSGDIQYKGDPESVNTQVAGSGDITKVN
ncbi:DUF2807 domain-containing protein [Bacteroidia bacterium]|nr:DUF2807 domain-containing protein [Bacteroidia bacterium]GHT45750.1 DUF2807 domain-containing protein [Bacteroidia bacterium]